MHVGVLTRLKLADVRRFALALPDVTEEPHHEYSSFRVRGKIFATAPPDGKHVHVFVDDDSREQAVELYPEFVEKLFWGGKVRGIRIRLASATPGVVKDLVRSAWLRKAGTR